MLPGVETGSWPKRQAQQQLQLMPSSSSETSDIFSQAGGRSSSTISSMGLKILKSWRVLWSDQKATTVSSGGQPGTVQVSSVTRIAASSGSAKRTRVHSFTRSAASRCWGLFFSDPIFNDDDAAILSPAGPA